MEDQFCRAVYVTSTAIPISIGVLQILIFLLLLVMLMSLEIADFDLVFFQRRSGVAIASL